MAFPRALIAPLLLAVGGTVCYHLAAKSIPKTLDAALVLIIAYATALAASIATYFLLPGGATPVEPVHLWQPTVMGLGLAAFLIELGYVLMYWAAWPISMASVLTNGLVAVLLVPIGAVVFREKLSILNVVGLILCLAGLTLLRR
jgi:multidrug transporter EmrE-like cation transporter